MNAPSTPLPVVKVYVRRPRGRWKLLGEFTDRRLAFAVADGWDLIYLNDVPTAEPPPGFERRAPATRADADD